MPKAERPRAEIELAFGTKGRKDRRDELPEDKFNIGSGTGNFGTGKGLSSEVALPDSLPILQTEVVLPLKE